MDNDRPYHVRKRDAQDRLHDAWVNVTDAEHELVTANERWIETLAAGQRDRLITYRDAESVSGISASTLRRQVKTYRDARRDQ